MAHNVDKSMKFAFKCLGEMIHEYFGLEGEYLLSVDTEVISRDGKNYRMDIAYISSETVISNIEIQTTPVREDKLNAIKEYIQYIDLHTPGKVGDIVVVTNVNPKYSLKRIKTQQSKIIELQFVYLSPEDIMKRINSIKDKVDNNKSLDKIEAMGLAVLPVLAQKDIAEEVTSQACRLLQKDKSLKKETEESIAFVIYLMLDRNVKNTQKRKELMEMINMIERKTALESLIEEETREIIKEKDETISVKDEQLQKKDETISVKDEQLKEREKTISVKDEQLQENQEIFTKIKTLMEISDGNISVKDMEKIMSVSLIK